MKHYGQSGETYYAKDLSTLANPDWSVGIIELAEVGTTGWFETDQEDTSKEYGIYLQAGAQPDSADIVDGLVPAEAVSDPWGITDLDEYPEGSAGYLLASAKIDNAIRLGLDLDREIKFRDEIEVFVLENAIQAVLTANESVEAIPLIVRFQYGKQTPIEVIDDNLTKVGNSVSFTIPEAVTADIKTYIVSVRNATNNTVYGLSRLRVRFAP